MSRPRRPIDPDAIEALLTGGGWQLDRITEDTWRGRFRGRSRVFPLLLRLDPAGYLVFAIVPFVPRPEAREHAHALYNRLLELNHAMLMAKFSIDDDLDVTLSVEYPTGELDPSEFTDALNALSFYADAHFEALAALGSA